MRMCERQHHCTSQWGQWTPLSEHVYCVAVTFKMTEQAEQWICIKFCVNLEHSSGMVQKVIVIGNWQLHQNNTPALLCITSHAGFFGKTSNYPGDATPLKPRFSALCNLAFSKTKVTFEREEISDCQWDSEKSNRAADGNWENCVRSQGTYFEGNWGIIVLYTMFLLTSSINVSFHITWLDNFWTDLIYKIILY